MKNDKHMKISKLVYLYTCLIFQKTTIIILLISFILMSLGLVLFSNPTLEVADYVMAFKEIHNSYFQQGTLLLQIFNSIIIVSVVIVINVTSNTFDLFFISYESRFKICLAKFLSLVLFSFLIIIIEMILLYGISIIRFNKLYLTKEVFISNIFVLLSLIFESLLNLCFSTLVSSIFIPMMILFLSIIIKVIINNYNNVNEFISLFYPVINLNKNNIIEMNNFIVISIWIILLFFLYVSIYNVKEISNK